MRKNHTDIKYKNIEDIKPSDTGQYYKYNKHIKIDPILYVKCKEVVFIEEISRHKGRPIGSKDSVKRKSKKDYLKENIDAEEKPNVI